VTIPIAHVGAGGCHQATSANDGASQEVADGEGDAGAGEACVCGGGGGILGNWLSVERKTNKKTK